MRVSPTSTPNSTPKAGFTWSMALGLPPSDSYRPASTTSPSSSRADVTLVIVPPLSPVCCARADRLSGPCWKSLFRTIERLSRRRSRTVAFVLGPKAISEKSTCQLAEDDRPIGALGALQGTTFLHFVH